MSDLKVTITVSGATPKGQEVSVSYDVNGLESLQTASSAVAPLFWARLVDACRALRHAGVETPPWAPR